MNRNFWILTGRLFLLTFSSRVMSLKDKSNVIKLKIFWIDFFIKLIFIKFFVPKIPYNNYFVTVRVILVFFEHISFWENFIKDVDFIFTSFLTTELRRGML